VRVWLATLLIGAMLVLAAVPFVGLAPEPPAFGRGAVMIVAGVSILAILGTELRTGAAQRARIMRRSAAMLAVTWVSLVLRNLVAGYDVLIPTMDLLPDLFGLQGEDVDDAFRFEGFLEIWLVCALALLAVAALRRAMRRPTMPVAIPGPWDQPAPPSSSPGRWNGATILLFVVGLGTLGGAIVDGHWTAEFLDNSVHVTGTIADPQPHPLIRFMAADGALFQFRQNGSVSRPLGADVPVAYQTEDPAGTARADTFRANWSNLLGLLWVGVGFTVAPFFGFRAVLRGGRW
jgi:hypothetical protein